MLVDIIAVDSGDGRMAAGDATMALLRECGVRARDMGAVAVRGWSVTDHPYDFIVRRAARRQGWLHFRRGNYMIYRLLDENGPSNDRGSVERWYITRIFTEGPSG